MLVNFTPRFFQCSNGAAGNVVEKEMNAAEKCHQIYDLFSDKLRFDQNPEIPVFGLVSPL